ncbi:unnamed protein product, partial [Iphiclides podalirius]
MDLGRSSVSSAPVSIAEEDESDPPIDYIKISDKNAWFSRAYTLAEPDGTTRIVEYTADKHNGFNAIVKRIGQAQHPQIYNTHDDGAGYYGYH